MGNRIHTEVIHYWQRHGIEVELLTFDASLQRDEFEVLDDIPVYRLPIGGSVIGKSLNAVAKPLINYPYFPGILRAYHRFLQGRHYDFAHVETAFPLGAVASLLPRNLHPPMAVTLPGADVMAEPAYDYGYARYPNVRWVLRRVWQRAALVRADSRYIRRRAIELGCAAEKALAIPYNITDGDFPPDALALAAYKASARAELLGRHNLAADARIVVSLSRLHPFKGVEFLIKAAPETLTHAPQTVFLIAGPRRSTASFGDYASYLERLTMEQGTSAAVQLIGAVPHEEVPRYLAGADAVVVPSVVEALNRVAIEAAAWSTPAVVTRTTGISEYMVEHGYGLVVEPQSPTAIAAALRILLTDPQRQQALGATGPALAARFRSDPIANDLLLAYQHVLSGGSGKAELPNHANAIS